MDAKTKLMLWIQAALVVTLFAVIADHHESETETVHTEAVAVSHETAAVSHEAGEKTDSAGKDSHAAEVEPVEKTTEEKSEPEMAVDVSEKAAPEPKKAETGNESGEFTAVITMKNPAYKEHTKGIVQFTHLKHYEEYKIGCGDCHHDDNAEPLTDLKPGDPVEGCIECHPKPGKAPGKGKLDQSQKLEYHTEALHQNCIVCHKQHNKNNNTKAAPQSCNACHPKNKN